VGGDSLGVPPGTFDRHGGVIGLGENPSMEKGYRPNCGRTESEAINVKEKAPPFYLLPSDDDIAGAPGPKKKERVQSEFEPIYGYPLFSFLYKL